MAIDKLTQEQTTALQDFAFVYGRRWKSELRRCWETGKYPVFVRKEDLQAVRNILGPKGIVKIKFNTSFIVKSA